MGIGMPGGAALSAEDHVDTVPDALPPSVKLVVIPNPRPRSPAAHGFADNAQALVDLVAAWLEGLKL